MRIAVTALLLLAAAAPAQDAAEVASRFLVQEQEAFAHYNAKDFPKAVAAFERQIATYADNPRPYYNIACCYALEGNAERAGTWLAISIQRGWRDARHLATDTDFDGIRQSPEYIVCLAKLKRARDIDPDPVPRDIAPGSVPPAPSVSVAVALSQLQEKAVRDMRVLDDVHRFRKKLFEVLDRRMAVLARYIIENGDAADASEAAVARVGTAALYLAEAEGQGEPDLALREAGAAAVLRTAEEFLRGYPGDPLLPGVLLARAMALRALGRNAEAIAVLRTVRADHPAAATRAEAELCALLPAGSELREVYEAAKAKLGREGALMRARLLCEGMPDLLDLDASVAARVQAHEGLVAYVFVACDDSASERMLRGLPPASDRFLPVVVCVNEDVQDAELDPWLREHGRGFPAIARGAAAAERLWLNALPMAVVARRDGTVVAVDPDAAEFQLLGGG
jgi:tetratricopeptide (TPR) repeat protein